MHRIIAVLFLSFFALSLQAVTPHVFPDDYKQSPCVVKEVCASFERSAISGAGAAMQSYTLLRQKWITAHWDKLMSDIKPYCAKLATCYATPGNTSMFCNDVVLTTMMSVCDQYPAKSDDHDQCFMLMRSYSTGIDLKAWGTWEEAQACGKANIPPNAPPRQLDLVMIPKTIPPDFDGKILIHAFDKETHVPIKATISVEGETLYTRETPDGVLTTSYRFPWKTQLRRTSKSGGHSEYAPPMVTITREGYETITFPMPVEMRKLAVTMTPSIDKLKRGANTVTITAVDPVTKKPVDARVMIGERDFAEANQPFELELKRGEKRPEIWVRSSFERYDDVVVAPAER